MSLLPKTVALLCVVFIAARAIFADPPAGRQWRLVFHDDFDATNADLDKRWNFQNCANSHILCSRWRENATVENGILKLMNKKETRGGQDWTSASMWTKRKFLYGYFEARYKYAPATGTNNSFWLITTGSIPADKLKYEIDINEGHYPSEVNTNLHNWSETFIKDDGTTGHYASSKAFEMSDSEIYAPWASFECVNGVSTSKLRVYRGSQYKYFHLREIRAFGDSQSGYQDPQIANYSAKFSSLYNLAYNRPVTASGTFDDANTLYQAANAVDNSRNTDWTSNMAGDKWLVVELDGVKTVKCVQTYTGWGNNQDYISQFKIQYFDDAAQTWKPLPNTAGIHHFLNPVSAKKFRLRANTQSHFHIREFRIYKGDTDGYPSAYIDSSALFANAVNVAKTGVAVASGSYDNGATATYAPANAIDGKIGTSWCSQTGAGEKFFEVDLPETVDAACIQIVSGWYSSAAGAYVSYLEDYVLEYFDETAQEWKTILRRSSEFPNSYYDLSENFHIYGLEWNEDELVYYYDGKPLRRVENTGNYGVSAGICDTASPVYLSEAIAAFAGEVTDAIDGTSMDVDWVKIYSLASPDNPRVSYDAWRNEEGLDGMDALPTSVTAPTGETNLARYAFRLDATLVSAHGGGFDVVRSGGKLNFKYRVAAYAENVSFAVQVSSDMKTWNDVDATVSQISADSQYVYFNASIADSYLSGAVFLRMKVSEVQK